MYTDLKNTHYLIAHKILSQRRGLTGHVHTDLEKQPLLILLTKM